MSGIAGVYNLDCSPVDADVLRRMGAALIRRGPDRSAQWTQGCVGLAHQALRTTPESLFEIQPLVDEAGTHCLVFDGRVDNGQEIKRHLAAAGLLVQTETDAELVLRAYELWGEACAAKIIGDFSFAVWNTCKRELYCARDYVGMRPFYYYRDEKVFVFASEMQALFLHPRVPQKPNLATIGLYLINRFEEREETQYADVLRLAPRHSLMVRADGIRKRQYWDFDGSHELRYQQDSEYAEHFLDVFKEAVRCRLRCNADVAAFLSGGQDSTAIVATAEQLRRSEAIPQGSFETYSIVFDDLPCDERMYINDLVAANATSSHFIHYESECEACMDMSQQSEFPDVEYSPTLLMNLPALFQMRARGVRVVLDGIGGDELLASGFAHLTDLTARGSFLELLRQSRSAATIYGVRLSDLVLQYCIRPFVPRAVKNAVRPLLTRCGWRTDATPGFVRKEFLHTSGIPERLRREKTIPRFPFEAQRLIYSELTFGWTATMAIDHNELVNSAFSVETRRPFFDRRVSEFVLAIPGDQRWRDQQPKFILREAMKGLVPERVRLRKGKTEFSAPLDREFADRQAATIEWLFQDSALAAWGLIDSAEFLRTFQEYRAKSGGYLTAVVMTTIAWELWCRWFEGRHTRSVGDSHERTRAGKGAA